MDCKMVFTSDVGLLGERGTFKLVKVN